MSDLISRCQISRYIKTQINPYGKPFEGSLYEFGLKVMEYIENMETAYELDEVIKEVHEYFKNVIDEQDGEEIPHEILRYNKDICKIIKKGRCEEWLIERS